MGGSAADRRLNTTFPIRSVSLTASIRASSLRSVCGGQRNRRASAAPATGDQSYRWVCYLQATERELQCNEKLRYTGLFPYSRAYVSKG
jgi:hypothetical protein